MAKKGNRVQVILECTEHKNSGLPDCSITSNLFEKTYKGYKNG